MHDNYRPRVLFKLRELPRHEESCEQSEVGQQTFDVIRVAFARCSTLQERQEHDEPQPHGSSISTFFFIFGWFLPLQIKTVINHRHFSNRLLKLSTISLSSLLRLTKINGRTNDRCPDRSCWCESNSKRWRSCPWRNCCNVTPCREKHFVMTAFFQKKQMFLDVWYTVALDVI